MQMNIEEQIKKTEDQSNTITEEKDKLETENVKTKCMAEDIKEKRLKINSECKVNDRIINKIREKLVM